MKKLLILFSFVALFTSKNSKYCDIKGFVNNPGVYEIKENYKIEDIINDAGGLKKEAYTDNINLSKKVYDEMVIYISSKNEIDYLNSLNKCVCLPIYEYIECEITEKDTIENNMVMDKDTFETNDVEDISTTVSSNILEEVTTLITTKEIINEITTNIIDTRININTCTLDELLSIKGLGEKKAQNIINYRIEFGLFNSIEEILKVSGIADATYKQIKDYIKV